MGFNYRYAQEKGGQKLHIVPTFQGDYDLLNTALCGKRATHWRYTYNFPMGHACMNCVRVNRQRGNARALELISQAVEYLKRRSRDR